MLDRPPRLPRPLLSAAASPRWSHVPIHAALLFAVTTPVGIAIGLGIRETLNPGSETASVVSGVLDAFSVGVLIYTGLVEVRGFLFFVFLFFLSLFLFSFL